MTKRQFNVEIPEEELQRIKRDAIAMKVSLITYTMEVFRRFRKEYTKEQRRAMFAKEDAKTVGRKIANT